MCGAVSIRAYLGLWGWLQQVVRAALLTHQRVPGESLFLHVAQGDERRCWEVVLKHHYSPLSLSFTLLHGQGCVIPQGVPGTPPAKPESERKQNAGGPVPIAGLKISCPLVSETHFPGKMSQLWHSALFASESKVEKSISKRWIIIGKGSLWAEFILSPVEEPTSISCGFMKKLLARVLAFALSQANSVWQVLLSQCRSALVLGEAGSKERKVVMTLQKSQWALIQNPVYSSTHPRPSRINSAEMGALEDGYFSQRKRKSVLRGKLRAGLA